MAKRFREALEGSEFVVTCEMIAGRGAFEVNQQLEYDTMKAIFGTGRACAISITDCPSGNPAIMASAVARKFLADGVESLVHFTCKDRSRNAMQGELYDMQHAGLENLLVMTGDYQTSGYEGAGRPDFDLDPVNALRLINAMNEGLVVHGRKGDMLEMPAHFYTGAVVNPFKYREGETIPQYIKLEKKIICGAKFIIGQLGYDPRKMHEQLLYLRERGYDVPCIANIFLLTKGAAAMMQKGRIAGCHISEKLMNTISAESAINKKKKGYAREKRIDRAAKMIAVSKGMGYRGVHIGGFGLDVDTFNEILDLSKTLDADWERYIDELSFGETDGYYLYRRAQNGLNTTEHSGMSEDIGDRKLFKWYATSRRVHKLLLTQDYERDETGLRNKRDADDKVVISRCGFNKLLYKSMEKRFQKYGFGREHRIEHAGKAFIYGCIDCGDCGLESTIYSCPMAQCPKSQRNGPCGGSMDGWCEVFVHERYCIHYMAYHRLKKYDELWRYTSWITVANKWKFWQTSAWYSYTHGLDNAADRIYVSLGLDGNKGALPDGVNKLDDEKNEADKGKTNDSM